MSAAVLKIFKDDRELSEVPVSDGLNIGRAENCAIVLNDSRVSRIHAELQATGDKIQIEKKSKFGVISLNGQDVDSASIQIGDRIEIGPFELRLLKGIEKRTPTNENRALKASGELENNTVADELIVPDADGGDFGLDSEPPSTDQLLVSPEGGEGDDDRLEEITKAFVEEIQNSSFIEPGGDFAQKIEDFDPFQEPMNVGDNEVEPFGREDNHPPDEAIELDYPDDAPTKEISSEKVDAVIEVLVGDANVERFEVRGNRVVIGRSNQCDIVIPDPKSSRKNTEITKSGPNFYIKDLASSNGTRVNGINVEEALLTGDDMIMVGDTEFQFQIRDKEFERQRRDFAKVEDRTSISRANIPVNPEHALFIAESSLAGMSPQISGVDKNEATNAGTPGIVGISEEKPKNIIERFKKDKRFRILVFGTIILGLFIMEMDEPNQNQISGRNVTQKKVEKTERGKPKFHQLSKEQQEFVKRQKELGFEYFKQERYDESLNELNQIFQYVDDYDGARVLRNYALEAKRSLESKKEEERRKRKEQEIKDKIFNYEQVASEFMNQKEFEKAESVFDDIKLLDPENANVARWRQQIADYRSELQLAQEEERLRKELRDAAMDQIKKGVKVRDDGRYLAAIDEFKKVFEIKSLDTDVLDQAQFEINDTESAIKSKLQPLLDEGLEFENAGQLSEAFSKYEEASRVDPREVGALEGMDRIRGTLDTQAKLLYTEAVILESLSDFTAARKKFLEILKVAPKDNRYYQRASDKLKEYEKFILEGVFE